MEQRGHRVWKAAAAVMLLAYFVRMTQGSLHAYFSADDVTNLYRSWSYPVSRLARAALLFFETSPFYRPMGSIWYRSIYYFAGFDPLPFHAINLLILLLNGYLTYDVARRLGNAREIGVLAVLLSCFHPAFNGLYFDTGFVYDVLCYFFYFSAFALYLRVRQAGRLLSPAETWACCGLYICALESKEMAVTLPVFLAGYEWLYHKPQFRQLRMVTIAGVMTVFFVIGRLTGAESLIGNPAYTPVFTWTRFMETNRQFLGVLFFRGPEVSTVVVLLIWTVLLAIALISRRAVLRFAWLFLMLSAAPIAFLAPRGASQYYVTLFGWALFGGAALACGSAWLVHRLPAVIGAWVRPARAPVVFTALMLALYMYYGQVGGSAAEAATLDEKVMRSINTQLHALQPVLPSGARLLFRNEPDTYTWENLIGLVRLSYRDDTITVDRAVKMQHALSERELSTYDHVFEYENGRLTELVLPPDPRLKPVVVEIFHSDFSRLSAGSPARRGEFLIVKATGLGPTHPEIAAGRPFPQEPLLAIGSRVAVKVNGRPAEVGTQIGWPRMIDTYRVDFRVPANLPRGMARVELSVRGVFAPAVELAVR